MISAPAGPGGFDLTRFSLREMTELGRELRHLGAGAGSMEEVADRVVRCLFERLVDPGSGEPSCALVRFFKTHALSDLADELVEVATRRLPEDEVGPRVRCLTLLATAGVEADWNRCDASRGHRAIPLVSEAMVRQAPMIARLLRELGVQAERLVGGSRDLLVEEQSDSFNVFYVPDAPGSPYIPEQESFVAAYGIRSVLGFGGALPGGDIFAVIVFSRTRIPRQTAELFRTLALSVKVAALPFGDAVFESAP